MYFGMKNTLKSYRNQCYKFRSVPVQNPGQNGDVFVPDRIPDRSSNSGRIPAGTPRFRTGCSVPGSAKTTSFTQVTKRRRLTS